MSSIDKETEQRMSEYRRKNFDVTVAKQGWLSGDDISISVTHNGFQWFSITANLEELCKISDAIRKYLDSEAAQ